MRTAKALLPLNGALPWEDPNRVGREAAASAPSDPAQPDPAGTGCCRSPSLSTHPRQAARSMIRQNYSPRV